LLSENLYYEGKVATYGNSQVITAGKLSDLTNVSKRSAHDNGLVPKLFVVVEDGFDAGNTWVLLLGVVLLCGGLVPVENTPDERRDEEGTGFSSADGLGKGENEGQITVDAVVILKDTGGLDTLPC
jgi:hypothetical protein